MTHQNKKENMIKLRKLLEENTSSEVIELQSRISKKYPQPKSEAARKRILGDIVSKIVSSSPEFKVLEKQYNFDLGQTLSGQVMAGFSYGKNRDKTAEEIRSIISEISPILQFGWAGNARSYLILVKNKYKSEIISAFTE